MNKFTLATVICLITFFTSVFNLNAQSTVFEWAKNMGGTNDDYGYAVTSDVAGNVYTVGSFKGTADFNPGAGVANLTANGPSPDIFISKLDASGNFVWVKQISGDNFEECNAIKLDAAGNIYVSGYFRGTVDFDPGVGVTSIYNLGQYDIFVAKLTTTGDLIWVKTMVDVSGVARGESHSLDLDASGNIYLTGTFNNTIDFDPGAATVNLTSNGDYDLFVLKLDASGNYVWAKNIGSTGADYGSSIKVDNSGNIYTTGNFSGTVDFDPGVGTSNLTSSGVADIFVMKMNSSGNYVWAKSMGGTGDDRGLSLALDVSNNVYTTGYFNSTVDFNPGVGIYNLSSAGSADIYIQKLDNSGNFVWANKFGAIGDDRGLSMTLDTAKNVYTTGYFNKTVDFDPSVGGVANLTASNFGSLFISKLDASGNYIWSKSTFGTGSIEHGNAIYLDAGNSIYVAGYVFGTADFNPDAGVTNLTSAGSYDATVMKFSQCSNMSLIETRVACDSYTWTNGTTYTSSNNTAVQNLVSAGGCDSTVTLNLTIHHSSTGIDTKVACDSYTWINGVTYTSSNSTATKILTNAAGCDSTVTLHLTIKHSSTGIDTKVACDSYTWIDGNTYTSSNNTATKILTNSVGCDSTVTLHLTINHSTTGTDTQVACDSYTWIDGNTYTSSNNTATKHLTNAHGCDSLVTLNLTIKHSTISTDTKVACDTYTWINGLTYTSSNNTATHHLTNVAGCDSTVTLNLTINHSTTGTDTQVACDTYTWIDGLTYTSSNNTATHHLTNAHGCDSLVTLNLTIKHATTGIDTKVACDTYTWIDGNTYTSSNNTATKMLTNVAGCDSLVTLNLTINHSTTGTDTQVACDTYTWIDGNTYTSSNNTATHHLTNAHGCDSLVTLNLTIKHSTISTDTQVACDTYTWIDGNTYTSSNNTATKILTNVAGCDSTVTLNLTINHSTTGTDTKLACDSYTWIDGITYTSSNNTATHHLTNAHGCDSLVTLNLTINHATTGTDTKVACDSYTWIDGNTYTSSNNTATKMLTSTSGCDSLVTLNLTINHSTTGIDTQVACDTYTWIDGITYTSSNNTATHHLTNVAGCDSLVTLNLTIKHSTTGTDTQVACDTYTWIDGNTYTSSNNTATHQLTNVAGCDSTVTLNLTINNSTTGTDTQVACDTYTWIDGITYTSSNNTATHHLTNAHGCDSLVTLNLTITHATTGTDTQLACDTYTWIDGNTYTTSNNTATQMLSTVAGCDSLVTLNLTISHATTGTDTQVACDAYTWIDGNTYSSSNNTATQMLTSVAGCDSLVTLNLTIKHSTTGTDTQVACDSYTWIDGNTYTSSNSSATKILTNAVGCDSTVTLNLTIKYSTTGTDTQVACDTYTWIDGNTYTSSNNSATMLLTNVAGCDSIVTLNLTINHASTGTDSQLACDSYTWIDGNTYTSSNNTATQMLSTVAGCDSLVTLNLTISHATTGTDTQVACDTYTWIDGNTYSSSNNTATQMLTSVAGCDSLVTLNLTIKHSTTGTDTQVACDTYTWIDGNTYTSSNNTATKILTNAAGCDSTVTLNLTLNHSTTGTDTQIACDSYTWIDGVTYTSSNNTATHMLTTGSGCDSLVTLNLIINHATTGTDTQVACDTYTWIDGNTYTSSNNTATHMLTTGSGCDSLVTLNLTIKHSTTGIDTQVACDTYTWIDGNAYTSSNSSATKILTNAVGCDSTVTLHLTIHNSNVVTDTHVACDSYTWIDGVTYNSNNNTATKHYTNMNGCDSLVKLNLTINHSTSTIDTKVACNTFTWSNGITYTSSTNTATQMLTTSKGCDSLVTLHLTVNHMYNTIDVETACHSYMWIDGNTYTSNNNTATFAYTTTLGCDSIVTLNLTIKSTDAATILSNFTIIARNNTATYQWINCNDKSIIVGATNQTFTASENGSYAVIVTENGCSDTSACVAISTMGLDEFTINSLEIYPNPSKGQFVIETASDISISISDVSGKLISIQELHAGKNAIDIQGVEPGMYLINCTDKSGRSVTKRINIMDI